MVESEKDISFCESREFKPDEWEDTFFTQKVLNGKIRDKTKFNITLMRGDGKVSLQ